MNKVLYENRCKCKENISIKKPRKINSPSEGKPLQYPNANEVSSKTFQINYDGVLSLNTKLILNSFQKKYFYYVIDDILYLLTTNSIERENLLEIIYSPVLSLQNTLSVDFFDIWIHELYINEATKANKFLVNSFQNSCQITIKILYKTKNTNNMKELLW